MNNNQLQIQQGVIKSLESEEWYQAMIEECKAIVVETSFNSRIELIKQKWLLGERILKENENFARKEIYGEKIVQRVAESLEISSRDLWLCIKFAGKYPNLVEELEISVNLLPEGKDISWRKIVNKYLPEPKHKDEKSCPHPEIEEISFLKCKKCKENLGGHSRILPLKEDLVREIKAWAEAKKFPKINLHQESTTPLILSGKREWENYLQNRYRTVAELWKVKKSIETQYKFLDMATPASCFQLRIGDYKTSN